MEHKINAHNQTVGRLASQIALLLQGKMEARYNPRLFPNTRVVVTNAKGLTISGKKYDTKVYYHHTGYMGHLREKTFRQEFEKRPSEVLRKAIYNMLPKNRLRQRRLNQLKIYDGEK